MATHPYGLRARLSTTQPTSAKSTPTKSPYPRTASRSPRKPNNGTSLNLRHVIGTTTTNPNGLSVHSSSDTFAYCAGSAAVLAKVEPDASVTQRFFRARPLASSINPHIPYYEPGTPTGTPTKHHSIMPGRLNSVVTSTHSPARSRWDEDVTPTWTARERIKAVTCVSISSDGRFLAVGEAGYNPRVLIFSTSDIEPVDAPLSIIAEHSFGVKAVRFSPDSKFLATLGDVNDGFLFIWAVNPKSGAVRLHSTNKCKAEIREMTWVGNSIITVGTRHVKAWRIPDQPKISPSKKARLRLDVETPASPGPVPLTGRNVLLGSLADSIFCCVTAISDHQAIICTEDGSICLFDESLGAKELRLIKRLKSPSKAIAYTAGQDRACFGDNSGNVHPESVLGMVQMTRSPRNVSSEYRQSNSRNNSPKQQQQLPNNGQGNWPDKSLLALGCLSSGLVSVDCNRNLQISKAFGHHGFAELKRFTSHKEPIQGIRVLPKGCQWGLFYTWTAAGEVKFWDSGGALLKTNKFVPDQHSAEDDDFSNDLVTVHYSPELDQFLLGDQAGVLTCTKPDNWETVQQCRAHGAQINGIVSKTIRDALVVVSCGRDRMVQLFRATSDALELVQTMDDHIGSVSQVLVTSDGERLLSSSSDRTVIVRDRISRRIADVEISAFLTARIVTLKATPISMALIASGDETLAISTTDRQVMKMNIISGAIFDSFKASDPENDDTVALQCIFPIKPNTESTPQVLVGYSSHDKSVRIYDYEKNVLLTREAGHIEGISDLALLEENCPSGEGTKRTVISTGMDGIIMIWDLIILSQQPSVTTLPEIPQSEAVGLVSNMTPRKTTPCSLPPLRKVLTKLDINEFSRIDPVSGSSVPARDPSPARLRRKTSRLTMAANNIPENEVPVLPPSQMTTSRDGTRNMGSSPPLVSAGMDCRMDGDRARSIQRSPSPTHFPAATPAALHIRNRSNNSRLRRPPSIPTDLRAQANQHIRRRSAGNVNEFGGLGMASDQACRMLRMYRKRLTAAHVEIDLNELEDELQSTLKVVQLRKSEIECKCTESRPTGPASGNDSDVENLTALLEKTGVADEGSEVNPY